MAKVAFLGLGVMGYPMAGHLKNKGGHEVTVYNRTTAKAEQWAKEFGGKVAKTPEEAAAGQDFVMMCVGNDDDVRKVAGAAFPKMGKDTVFVDHTTASAEVARELYEAREEGRLPFRRRAGVGRTGGRAERRAHRDVRRRCRALRPRRAGDRRLCAHVQAARPRGRRPAHQDGQPDLHRRPGAGPLGRHSLRQEGRARRRGGDRDDLQGRRAVLADGEPLQDHERRQVRFRLRGRTGCARTSRSASARRGAPARTCRWRRWSISSIRKSRRWAAGAGIRRACWRDWSGKQHASRCLDPQDRLRRGARAGRGRHRRPRGRSRASPASR